MLKYQLQYKPELYSTNYQHAILNITYNNTYVTSHPMLHYIHKLDYDLDAFNHDPVGDSFTVLAYLLAAFTTYLN